jgi:phosphate/sulfate permease
MVDGAQPTDGWVLTLPAAIMLSATLYVLFVNIF